MDWITLALIDKAYYDYDYEEVPPKRKIVLAENTAMSKGEVENVLARFGWGKGAPNGTPNGNNDAKALQERVMRDINERGNRSTK